MMDGELRRAKELIATFDRTLDEIDELLNQDPRILAVLLSGYSRRGCPVNLAEWIRVNLKNKTYENIVEAWEYLESQQAMTEQTTLRTTLNRESKKLFGHPLAVVDGDLVYATSRSKG